MKIKKFLPLFLLTIFSAAIIFPHFVNAQKRDNLTAEEIELIRNYQEIDKRMEIYLKAIDRRFLLINDANAASNKQVQKDLDEWGELPVGSRTEIYSDISKILDETISKIDDIAAHDIKNELLPKAVHTLADGCRMRAPQFNSLLESAKNSAEKGAMLNSIDFCNQIIEASAKIAKPEKNDKKKKKANKEKTSA